MSSDESDDPMLLRPHRPRRKETEKVTSSNDEPSEPPLKRRRLSNDALVLLESSDVGEQEQLAAEGDDYWLSPPTTHGDDILELKSVSSSVRASTFRPVDLPPSVSTRSLHLDRPSLLETSQASTESSVNSLPRGFLHLHATLSLSPKDDSRLPLFESSPTSSLLTPTSAQSSQGSIFRRLQPQSPIAPPQTIASTPFGAVPNLAALGPVRELRPRTKKQLAPFTIDRAEYERVLRNAREAIVRDKVVARASARDESQYEETQDAGTTQQTEESGEDFIPRATLARRRPQSRSPDPPPDAVQRTSKVAPYTAPSLSDEEIFARFGGVISDDDQPPVPLPKAPKRPTRPKRAPHARPFPFELDINHSEGASSKTGRHSSLGPPKSHSPHLSDGDETSESRINDLSSHRVPYIDLNSQHTTSTNARSPIASRSSLSPSSSSSGSEESDDSSGSIYLMNRDYKKMKALKHMQPWFLVKRALEGGTSPKTQKRTRTKSPSVDRTPTPEPLPPRSQDDLDDWVRYDDDYDRRPNQNVRTPADTTTRQPSVVEISDDQSNVSSSSNDNEVEFVAAARTSPGPRMERDLIDRMLSRSTYVRKGREPERQRKHRRVNHASHSRQTKLRFPVVDRTSHDKENTIPARPRQLSEDIDEARPSRRPRRRYFGGSLEDDDLIFGRTSPIDRPWPSGLARAGKPNPLSVDPPKASSNRFQWNRSTNNVIQAGPLPNVSPRSPGINDSIGPPSDWDLYTTFSLDFGIRCLPPGIKMPSTSFIGKGRLFELISLVSNPAAVLDALPRSYSGFGLMLEADPNYEDFESKLPAICDALHTWISSTSQTDTDADARDLMRYVALSVTRLIPRQTIENAEQACDEVEKQVQHLLRRFPEPPTTRVSPAHLHLQWFVVDVCARMVAALQSLNPGETPQIRRLLEVIERSISELITALLHLGMHNAMQTIKQLQADGIDALDDPLVELWVCVIHLTKAMSTRYSSIPSFSQQLETAIALRYPSGMSVHACEQIWYTTMSVCLLSQFTSSGITLREPLQETHWPIVLKALAYAPLLPHQTAQQSLSNVAAINRDKHICMILRRCCLMVARWGWDLSSAEGLLKLFNDLFKARKFSNLDLQEERKADFAPFLTNLDVRLLSNLEQTDTAYGLFLKLLAGTIDGLRSKDNEKAIMKLLGALIPVGVVTFTKEKPPTRFELSQLHNRYSAILLAIYLEPSTATRRIESARRILDFVKADHNSRQVCLRAVMYLGIMLRHLKLPPISAVQWTSEMMEIMLQEFSAALLRDNSVPLSKEGKIIRDEAEMMICLLVRSITKVIKVSSLDATRASPVIYPDIVFLQNSWTSKILRSASYVKSVVSVEILRYIQAFLDERLRALPTGTIPVSQTERDEESQDYGDADYEWDDPTFIQMLDMADGVGDVSFTRTAEKKVVETVENDLSPAVFQFISNIFANGSVLPPEGWELVDAAVDCWASCGYVIIYNNLRDWSSYVSAYGVESCTRLMNKADRRRVGLRFMYKAILLDPGAYRRCEEEFLSMWCQTIVRPRLTLEHKYTEALLQCKEARHGLLQPLWTHEFPHTQMDAGGLEAVRIDLIELVLIHASRTLADPSGDAISDKQKRIISTVLRELVPAMKDYYWVYMSADAAETNKNYYQLCQRVLASMERNIPQLLVNGDLTWLPPPQQGDIHIVQSAGIIH
ncbi:hypothetical protein DACRYDRAFT_114958 [Dacryopinax primogenitus]|uniref:Uncharacterized protein n=1 Tax=Dacryopinax primogenitus (strain DJM 731) TaxID=1858805 RepID=M5G4F8_DACPD|nr:uncharacterized protein DACRYDRAFT_114958 [Dacryopinax primogenitus]EJU03584.1 hypothetical protein DACRYDRAFT_114958 [Dacryopinax primogenitus]